MTTDPAILRREVKALVFDQYGTVVDMQGLSGGSGDAFPAEEGLGG